MIDFHAQIYSKVRARKISTHSLAKLLFNYDWLIRQIRENLGS